jgi:hypothetical protein
MDGRDVAGVVGAVDVGSPAADLIRRRVRGGDRDRGPRQRVGDRRGI